ncbi:hypothetical protein ANAPC5_00478 [Anaplasma phagocytophilum]|nr:hypothetical protein ANAPC2_00133 [Anaplasma phagocytophilum]SBO31179.1 hypothetical protein ANAPC3_00441 [Anaplasma phagocytophilum]SBO31530.1 hypothetical protein ANAPC4_00509 [Anaplasma phagocytophilum]SCV63162.1 hypothetical protein ANAPC5_00478 [Anaplasma phagocytophilum]
MHSFFCNEHPKCNVSQLKILEVFSHINVQLAILRDKPSISVPCIQYIAYKVVAPLSKNCCIVISKYRTHLKDALQFEKQVPTICVFTVANDVLCVFPIFISKGIRL